MANDLTPLSPVANAPHGKAREVTWTPYTIQRTLAIIAVITGILTALTITLIQAAAHVEITAVLATARWIGVALTILGFFSLPDINKRKGGFPPIVQAAMAGDLSLARALLKAGADANARVQIAKNENNPVMRLWEGATAYIVAKGNNDREIMELLEPYQGDLDRSYAEVYIQTKYLAHVFEISGEGSLQINENTVQRMNFGGGTANFMLSQLENNAQTYFREENIFTPFTEEQHTLILETLNLAHQSPSTVELYDRIHQGKPVLFATGSLDHWIYIVIANGKLMVADRDQEGIHGVEIRTLPRNFSLKQLRCLKAITPKREDFYRNVYKIAPTVERVLPLSPAKTDTCSYYNAEAAFFALMFSLIPEGDSLTRATNALTFFRNYSTREALSQCTRAHPLVRDKAQVQLIVKICEADSIDRRVFIDFYRPLLPLDFENRIKTNDLAVVAKAVIESKDESGSLEKIRELLREGANPKIAFISGQVEGTEASIIWCLAREKLYATVLELFSAFRKSNEVIDESLRKELFTIAYHMSSCPDKSLREKFGQLLPDELVFYFAIKCKDIESVESFLKKGLSPNLLDEEGIPVFSTAIRSRDFTLIASLVKANADVNARGHSELIFFDQTPLMILCEDNNDIESAEQLFKICGAKININAQNSLGYTALHVTLMAGFDRINISEASKQRMQAMVTFLISQGASVDIPDNKSVTATELAQKRGIRI